MGQRILVLSPWGVDYMDGFAKELISAHVRDDTEIDVANLVGEAPPLPWPAASASGAAVERVRKAEAEGYDAVIIACCADPFLAETRAAVKIPVVGLTEAVVVGSRARGKLAVLARGLSDDYLPLIPTQGNWDFWTNKPLGYGLPRDQFSLRRVMVPLHPSPEELERLTAEDPARLAELTLEAMGASLLEEGLTEAKAAVAEDGAEVLYFACAFWSRAIAGLGDRAPDFGAPVVNPLVTGATYAEHLVLSAG